LRSIFKFRCFAACWEFTLRKLAGDRVDLEKNKKKIPFGAVIDATSSEDKPGVDFCYQSTY